MDIYGDYIEPISKAFIIGNGFDLNLGLETSYKKFMESEFFELLLSSNNNICDWLIQENELNNWIDIENELKNIYQDDVTTANGQFINENSKERKKEFIELSDALCEFINQIDVDIYDKINKSSFYYTEFNEKFGRFINGYVINFNYTQTIKILQAGDQLNSKLVSIHGEARTNNIIFGVDENSKLDKRYDFFYKTSNPHYNCGNTIRELLEMKEIIFMGHSFGETDHYFFNKLFEKACEKANTINYKFTIYHYGIEDRRKIISEIRDLIGDHNTMNDFYSYNEVVYIDVLGSISPPHL